MDSAEGSRIVRVQSADRGGAVRFDWIGLRRASAARLTRDSDTPPEVPEIIRDRF